MYLKDFEYYEIDGQSYYFGAWQNSSGEEQVRITESLGDWADYANDFVNNQGLYLKDFEYYGMIISNTFTQEIDSEISVFPNPTDDYLKIDTKREEISNIKIYTLLGQLVFDLNQVNIPQTIDIRNFEKGIYILKLEISNSIISKKIIVN